MKWNVAQLCMYVLTADEYVSDEAADAAAADAVAHLRPSFLPPAASTQGAGGALVSFCPRILPSPVYT